MSRAKRSDRGSASSGPAATAEGDPRLASFLRGVTIGALVGAAIAGSAIWERAARRRAVDRAADPDREAPAG